MLSHVITWGSSFRARPVRNRRLPALNYVLNGRTRERGTKVQQAAAEEGGKSKRQLYRDSEIDEEANSTERGESTTVVDRASGARWRCRCQRGDVARVHKRRRSAMHARIGANGQWLTTTSRSGSTRAPAKQFPRHQVAWRNVEHRKKQRLGRK